MKKIILGLCFIILAPAALAERQALLIGNKNYKVSPLSNPINDVNGLKIQLAKLGFKITTRVNLNKEQMRKAVRDFRGHLRKGDMALVYYSGHGAQVAGQNYLLPIHHGIQEEFEVEDRAVSLNSILQSLANSASSSNIVILDACRDNPFNKQFKSATRGLARLEHQAQGTLVAFAASTGEVSNDGRGKYGTYTKHLIRHIATPNISLNEMFTRVRKAVVMETHRKQFPIVEDGLLETIFLTKNINSKEDERHRQKILSQKQLKQARQETIRQQKLKEKKLQARGYYYRGSIDGITGSETRSALQRFMTKP